MSETIYSQVSAATGLTKETVEDLFKNGWVFTQALNEPMSWTLPIRIEKEQLRE